MCSTKSLHTDIFKPSCFISTALCTFCIGLGGSFCSPLYYGWTEQSGTCNQTAKKEHRIHVNNVLFPPKLVSQVPISPIIGHPHINLFSVSHKIMSALLAPQSYMLFPHRQFIINKEQRRVCQHPSQLFSRLQMCHIYRNSMIVCLYKGHDKKLLLFCRK